MTFLLIWKKDNKKKDSWKTTRVNKTPELKGHGSGLRTSQIGREAQGRPVSHVHGALALAQPANLTRQMTPSKQGFLYFYKSYSKSAEENLRTKKLDNATLFHKEDLRFKTFKRRKTKLAECENEHFLSFLAFPWSCFSFICWGFVVDGMCPKLPARNVNRERKK